jgi:hypothetical protein
MKPQSEKEHLQFDARQPSRAEKKRAPHLVTWQPIRAEMARSGLTLKPGSLGRIMARLVLPQAEGKAAQMYFLPCPGTSTPRKEKADEAWQ